MSRYKAVIFDYHGVLLKHFRRQAGVYAFAQQLRQEGYQVAALSNLITPVAVVVKRLKHLDSFENRIISCDVGVAKPNPAIYTMMLEKLGLRPEECIFVDNRPRNLVPAAAMGMGVVRAKNTQQIVHDVRALLEPSSQTKVS